MEAGKQWGLSIWNRRKERYDEGGGIVNVIKWNGNQVTVMRFGKEMIWRSEERYSDAGDEYFRYG